MKHCNKKIILILIFACILAFTGCSNIKLKTFKKTDETNNNAESNEDITKIDASKQDKADSDDTNNESSTDSELPTPTTIQPVENVELVIYVVNSSTNLDPVTALIPADSELNPKLIVDTVVDSMADQSLTLGIESVTTQDDTVIISFYSNQPPLSDVGSGLETAILDALAQSITENLDDYNKIIYRVEGGPYISGHIELGIDEIYFED